MQDYFFSGDKVKSSRILYTPSDFAKESLVYLQETGKLTAKRAHRSARSKMNSFLFFIVVSGAGSLEYEGSIHRLRSGDCVFIDCSKGYAHETGDDLWTLKWVHFYGNGVERIYDKYKDRGGTCCFHPDSIFSFEEAWQRIFDTAGGDDYIRDMRIFKELSALLTLIMEQSVRTEILRVGAKRQDLADIKAYLDEHFTQRISLDELAARFFVNKFYLTRIFKEQYGVPISSYILEKRITYAKRLLRFTDLTVEDIGHRCGIGAPDYFSRTFKKAEGVSPSGFRKMW